MGFALSCSWNDRNQAAVAPSILVIQVSEYLLELLSVSAYHKYRAPERGCS